MDDDVEYLGTKFAPHEPLDDPCDPQPSVAGITLHVEKCGEKPAHNLVFYRAHSGYVNIGRKSASDDKSMRRENDNHNVVFACQVVSARHAKLVLSDSGQVYVVDLHSRHGTHLLRRGETTPRILKPEVETVLADGDVLTFGKVVGAGSYLVSPVTVRVELIKTRSAASEIPIAVPVVASPLLRALTPISSLSHVFARTRKPTTSGRYGLFVPPCAEEESGQSSFSSIDVSSDASSSSSSPSSPSEHESDIEDEPSGVPSVVREGTPAKNPLPAFRSFIREMYSNASAHSPPILVDDVDGPIEVVTPGVGPGSPSNDNDGDDDVEVVSQPSSIVVVIDPTSKSRSHSPMELSTPSPSPPEEVQQEPAVVGAWPASRPESPRHSSLEVEVAPSETAQEREAEPVPVSVPVLVSPLMASTPSPAPIPEIVQPQPSTSQDNSYRIPPPSEHNPITPMNLPPPPPFFPNSGLFGPPLSGSASIACQYQVPQGLPQLLSRVAPLQSPYKILIDRASSELKASIKSVEDRVTTLHSTVDDLKSRQTLTEEDVVDLQSHVDLLEPESERLLCRMNGAERNIASLSLLHGLVNSLRTRLDAPQQQGRGQEGAGDVRACAEALTNLVSEMKSMREDVEKRIEEKVEAMKVARMEALDVLKEVSKEAEEFRALKRKREEEEEERDSDYEEQEEEEEPEEEYEEYEEGMQEAQEDNVPDPDVMMEEPSHIPIPVDDDIQVPSPIPTCSLYAATTAPVVAREPQSPPPKKRARTAVFTVVHTAAAMAIGAAATWSALAFA